MKRVSLFLFLLVATIGFSSSRTFAAPPDLDDSAVLLLNNGARLIVLPEASSDTVSVNVFFAVGRADERGNAGINALLCRTWGEASAFRTAALLQGDIARTGSVGTEYSEDWVEIWGVSGNGDDDVRKSLQTVLVNLVANPLFTPEGIAAARQDQERAALLERDDLLTTAMDTLRGRAFGGSAYGISALGLPERLATIKPETLDAYYQKYFRPNRCVVIVAGKVRPDRIRRLVEASFGAGDWNHRPPAPAIPTITVTDIPVGLRDMGLARKAASTLFVTAWLAPGLAQTDSEEENRKRYSTLLLLDAVIGGGKAARLFRTLRDTDPVGYDVRTALLPGRGGSLWSVYLTGNQDREVCRAAVGREIGALADGKRPITEAELIRARAFCKTRHRKEIERIRDRAFFAGWSEVMGLGAAFATDFDTHLDAVTAEDMNQLARHLFNANSVTVFSQPIK